MEQARAVSGMIMSQLKGDSETILAANIGTSTSALLGLFEAVHAELKRAEKDKWVGNRNPDSVFKLLHHYMFRGTYVDNEELEQQWAQDEQLREKMPPCRPHNRGMVCKAHGKSTTLDRELEWSDDRSS